MKAAVFHDYGSERVLQVEEVPTPEVKPGQVLLKVLATGVNRLEHYFLFPTLAQP